MQPPTKREEGERLFLEHLQTIEQLLSYAGARASLREAEAEDFASYAKVKLIEDDYAILRQYEQRASFTAYISVVIHRMMLDYCIHLWGKWHPSAAARRLGAVAVELERILYRDGRTIQEALPLCRKLDPALTLESLQWLADRIPKRTRKPRPVTLDTVAAELLVLPDAVHDRALRSERAALSRHAAEVLCAALNEFSEDDRMMMRLHFGGEMSIAQVARVMGTEQKPLYRRLRRCLAALRRRLEVTGITWSVVEEILAGRSHELDLNLWRETRVARPSLTVSRVGEAAEGCVDNT